MKLVASVEVPPRLLVPKQMMIRRGFSLATASGMVYIWLSPLNCSHFRVVMAPTPMLTTPMLFFRDVKAVPVSSAYIMYRAVLESPMNRVSST